MTFVATAANSPGGASARPGSGTIEARIVGSEMIAQDVWLITLAATDGRELPPASAGSHIDVHLPDGLIRQYSLLDESQHPMQYRVAVKRFPEGRGGSSAITSLRPGDIVRVGGPRNSFPLDAAGDYFVMVAGGIGITPIYSMVRELERRGRSWELHYSCRSPEDAPFLDELRTLSGKLHLNFDAETGRMLDLDAIVADAPGAAKLYCCGPGAMLNAFEDATRHLSPADVHLERFTPPDIAPGKEGFVVVLAKSGRELFVPPGATILRVLEEAGIPTVSSCKLGICGTCETGVLEGIPDHRDSILTVEERNSNEMMMICCSGSLGTRLVLDM